MSARNAMKHRCTIQRDSSHIADHTDRWGLDNEPQWGTLLENLPCRFWFRVMRPTLGQSTVVTSEKRIETVVRTLILPIATVVTADDRVLIVKDQRGRVVADGPMRIDEIAARVDHLLCQLVRQF